MDVRIFIELLYGRQFFFIQKKIFYATFKRYDISEFQILSHHLVMFIKIFLLPYRRTKLITNHGINNSFRRA